MQTYVYRNIKVSNNALPYYDSDKISRDANGKTVTPINMEDQIMRWKVGFLVVKLNCLRSRMPTMGLRGKARYCNKKINHC